MDLQDFESQLMYFDIAMPEEVNELLHQGAEHYGEGNAEGFLLRAQQLAPDNLTVLVALYRFYYYQHRYEEAMDIAFRVMAVVGPMICFPTRWDELRPKHLEAGVMRSFTMVRFYLLALKGAAYLNFRMSKIKEGVSMLNKVIEMDSNDRLGAKVLMQAIGPAQVA